jgi:hypothetical protein
MQTQYTTRLEVSFPGKPASQVLGGLKQRGFWWDPARRVWWLARPVSLIFVRNEPVTLDGFAYALDYLATLGLTSAERAEIERRAEDHHHAQGARGMEMAQGIA